MVDVRSSSLRVPTASGNSFSPLLEQNKKLLSKKIFPTMKTRRTSFGK
jgi:hypothetical protein